MVINMINNNNNNNNNDNNNNNNNTFLIEGVKKTVASVKMDRHAPKAGSAIST